ncbi:septal ring lytic transglycosylase RlpA family protein [Myxacorys almedinensis]|uniref:Probable endolytic peptidoglycan transglycosylase RlpA n=1 Tax=Myxacorys almedinensis A TaxID=2690445 RepID=A0A8J8CMI6_9CYAN|nr:septal ring lytic transglycosylase RlpA family protein [Myxacorys almedinensis]NDJ17312.1 septal ring lytic transglycosylase RlpA family protein [Myxacorys almedinensis A]
MNKTLISGLTATLLLMAVMSATSSSNAETTSTESQETKAEPSALRPLPPDPRIGNSAKMGSQQPSTQPQIAQAQSLDVVKVGEQQTPASQAEDSIAKIQSHDLTGRKAATVYVKNIPVLTFVGPQRSTSSDIKMGEVQTDDIQPAKLKSGSVTNPVGTPSEQRQDFENSGDPIARATAIAAKLNQLHRQGVKADSITVSWKPNQVKPRDAREPGQYVIEADKITIIAVDSATILPDTTKNPEQDALQVTNRLRRLMGDAAPLPKVIGKPAPRNAQQVSFGPIRLTINGMASWYGPGFDGNRSASGEVFNQNAMTAAHKSLPFGTKVQVTNLDNGKSVVVRINDRGPFSGGRVIDLSAGAARILGLIQSGVAPVKLEVLDTRRRTAMEN